jgi:hypothetical protein
VVKVLQPVWAYTRLLFGVFILVASATLVHYVLPSTAQAHGVLFKFAVAYYLGRRGSNVHSRLALVDHLRETLTNRAHLPLIENSVGRQSLGLPSGGHVGCLPHRNKEYPTHPN